MKPNLIMDAIILAGVRDSRSIGISGGAPDAAWKYRITLDDIALVNEIALEIFKGLLDEMLRQTHRLLSQIREVSMTISFKINRPMKKLFLWAGLVIFILITIVEQAPIEKQILAKASLLSQESSALSITEVSNRKMALDTHFSDQCDDWEIDHEAEDSRLFSISMQEQSIKFHAFLLYAIGVILITGAILKWQVETKYWSI